MEIRIYPICMSKKKWLFIIKPISLT